jgi:hypothetical protein
MKSRKNHASKLMKKRRFNEGKRKKSPKRGGKNSTKRERERVRGE